MTEYNEPTAKQIQFARVVVDSIKATPTDSAGGTLDCLRSNHSCISVGSVSGRGQGTGRTQSRFLHPLCGERKE